MTIGSSVLTYATRDIAAGSEICTQYFGIGEPARTDFVCRCALCLNDIYNLPIPRMLHSFGTSPQEVVAHFQVGFFNIYTYTHSLCNFFYLFIYLLFVYLFVYFITVVVAIMSICHYY